MQVGKANVYEILHKQPHLVVTLFLSVSFFLILGLAALLWFAISVATLVSQLVSGSPVVDILFMPKNYL